MMITEILILAKVLLAVSCYRNVTVTDVEKTIAIDALRRIANNNFD